MGSRGSRSWSDQIVHARGLLRPEERAALPDVDLTVRTAIDTGAQHRRRNDVRLLLAGGHRLYEVPFSLRTNPPSAPAPAEAHTTGTMNAIDAEAVVLRGTIDCLVVGDDGAVVVVEFKTGVPRPSHQRQLDIYVEAARALFPGVPVTGKLIYAWAASATATAISYQQSASSHRRS